MHCIYTAHIWCITNFMCTVYTHILHTKFIYDICKYITHILYIWSYIYGRAWTTAAAYRTSATSPRVISRRSCALMHIYVYGSYTYTANRTLYIVCAHIMYTWSYIYGRAWTTAAAYRSSATSPRVISRRNRALMHTCCMCMVYTHILHMNCIYGTCTYTAHVLCIWSYIYGHMVVYVLPGRRRRRIGRPRRPPE